MTYYAARISFYKPIQRLLVKQETSDQKPIDLLSKLITESSKEFKAPRNIQGRIKKGYVDFILDNFLEDESSHLIAFKLGVKRTRALPKHDDTGFYDEENILYPNLIVLWDSERQTILIEKASYIKIERVITSLECHLQELVKKYELVVNIASVIYEKTFWDAVDKTDKLYGVRFVLFSPNLIFSKGAEEYLTRVKKNYNASQTVLELKNENGDLKLSKDDASISDILSWIVPGGGFWRLHTGQRTTIKSETGTKLLKIELVNYSSDEIKKVMNAAAELLKE